jgi:hypothetical protein
MPDFFFTKNRLKMQNDAKVVVWCMMENFRGQFRELLLQFLTVQGQHKE